MNPFGKALVLIVAASTAIVSIPGRPTGIVRVARAWLAPLVDRLVLRQSWNMFAPDTKPNQGRMYVPGMLLRLKLRGGGQADVHFPGDRSARHHAYLVNVLSLREPWILDPTLRVLARQASYTPDAPPVEGRLYSQGMLVDPRGGLTPSPQVKLLYSAALEER